MNEVQLITELTKGLTLGGNVIVGPGDDCAVLDTGLKSEYLLLKTDAVVEGIHFESNASPEAAGRKAINRNLSDVAAMGGLPEFALVTLGVPSAEKYFDYLRGFYKGMNEAAGEFGVSIVGGETVKNPERLLVSVAVTGKVEKKRCILRSGAKVGDAIFVTGELGGSISGKHLEFTPRIKEARWLTENFSIHAMIDLSDGIASDLKHILTASNCGAELLARSIPISRAARLNARAESSSKPPMLAALTDGEDFELLFTISPKCAVPLLDTWKKQFPSLKLSCIGKTMEGNALLLKDENGLKELKGHGYMHFQ